MSKQSRRARPGTRPTSDPRATGPAASPSAQGRPTQAGATPSDGSGVNISSSRPTGTRIGRRERSRPAPRKSFFERYRTAIIGLVVVAAVGLMAVWAFNSAGAAAYDCSVEFQAPAQESPGPDGYVQESMGNSHVPVGEEVTYTYCPPATGAHYNSPPRGPIDYRVYGPNDAVGPQGWVHNLEHGALVVLYRGQEGDPGLTEETQQALRDFQAGLPPSPVCDRPPNQYLVAARFDEMATPFAALVWGRILPLETLDTAAIQDFFSTVGEQAATMPERFGCPPPNESPAASPAASPNPS